MKYRLYGKEGVNDREIEKLKEWGIIKKNLDEVKRMRVKRRVKRTRVNSDGEISHYSKSDSRSCESAYETKIENVYIDNENGCPEDVNNGFEIKPLCPVIYGKKAA